jgi:hypothetical protein
MLKPDKVRTAAVESKTFFVRIANGTRQYERVRDGE